MKLRTTRRFKSLVVPLRLVSFPADRKSWKELNSGFVMHKCSFDRIKYYTKGGYKFYPCTHLGCDTVDTDL